MWIRSIGNAFRGDYEKYNIELSKTDFNARKAYEKLFELYNK